MSEEQTRGRPPLGRRARKVAVSTRLTPPEADRLQRFADREGLSRSAAIRELLRRALEEALP